MSDLERDFQRFVTELKTELKMQDRELEVREYGKRPARKYSLKAPKTFAWVTVKPMLNCLAVGTKQEWADKAGLDDYEYKSNTEFNGPGAHWKIPEGDIDRLQNVARYLAQVCKARHS
ncbi:MAG: hypothetical protein HY662_04365 [Chloroflexi bacterium]|nr:hypothetical protein [Chloroflexota bacterium]